MEAVSNKVNHPSSDDLKQLSFAEMNHISLACDNCDKCDCDCDCDDGNIDNY